MTQQEYQKIIELLRTSYIFSTFGVDQFDQNGEPFLKLSNGNICSLIKIIRLRVSDQIKPISFSEENNIRQFSKTLKCSDAAILFVTFDDKAEIAQHIYHQL